MSEESVVAKRLKEARTRAGISQKQLGVSAGMDEFSASPRIAQYESGKHEPDLRTLIRLSAVLKVPVPFFYCDDPELAQLILGFAKLKKVDRKRLLALLPDDL